MTTPTIHMNGTSKQGLGEPLLAAYDKLSEAYVALKETAPNGRDYYPQGPQAMQTATDEHMSRLRRVDEVRAEIEQLLIAIDY